jgi:RNA polymerase sigma-70 factor, ECF subfamily
MSERRRPDFDEVLAAARQGAPWAVGWLYRRYQPRLLRMLAVIAPHHAEDIAADVWLEVAADLARFSGDEGAFRAWLATTARYEVIEVTRRNGRRVGRALDDDAADQMASTAFAARVVAVLPPDQADVVLLRVGGAAAGGRGPRCGGGGQGARPRPRRGAVTPASGPAPAGP